MHRCRLRTCPGTWKTSKLVIRMLYIYPVDVLVFLSQAFKHVWKIPTLLNSETVSIQYGVHGKNLQLPCRELQNIRYRERTVFSSGRSKKMLLWKPDRLQGTGRSTLSNIINILAEHRLGVSAKIALRKLLPCWLLIFYTSFFDRWHYVAFRITR